MYTTPGFYIDMNACTGCKTCMMACIDKNDLPKDVNYRRVSEYVGGDWAEERDGTMLQNLFVYYITMACNHCEKPSCVEACPTTAMHKDGGLVLVDQMKCIGCRYCEWVCPYSAPQYNPDLGKMSKCDFCIDYLKEGKPPACVAACPTRALQFGDYYELAKEHGITMVAPLPDRAVTGPHLVITPHRHSKAVGSHDGQIVNPEEV